MPFGLIRVEHRIDYGPVRIRQCRAEGAQACLAADADGKCMGQAWLQVFQVDPLQRQ
ncbi:hypothetical protein D9M71_141680 [compost metagenome]